MIVRKNSTIFGALVLSFGALFSKGLGVLLRIALVQLIGSEGIGRYQTVYPTYLLLLTLSSVGLPSAVASLTARGRVPVKTAFLTVFPLGVVGSLLMALLSRRLALLQGEIGLLWAYLALSPSVLLVSGIAILRGYFQGKNQMLPTTVSEIIESSCKVFLGIALAYAYKNDLNKAVASILFAVTIGEGCAFLYLLSLKREKSTPLRRTELLKTTIPLSISASVLPFSSLIDSIFLTRGIGLKSYGLLTGCALTFVSLPASLTYGIGVAVLPKIAKGKREEKDALLLTLLFAVPIFLGCLICPQMVGLLFPDREELNLLVRLLSPVALLLPMVETLSSCLAGAGRGELSALSLLMGIIVKFFFQLLFLERWGVFGGAISFDLCYLVAFFLELWYSIKVNSRKELKYDHDRWLGYRTRRFNGEGKKGDPLFPKGSIAHGTCRFRRERQGIGRQV